MNCPICKRLVPDNCQERHHLKPRTKGKLGKETVTVCLSCGDQLHKLFSLKELDRDYNTVEKIVANEKVQKWVAWISKKPLEFSICTSSKKRR